MIERPSTSPGKTIGSEATLSRSQRPGSLVLTTIQQMTEVTSMITVALPKERIGVPHRAGEVRVGEDEAVRVEGEVGERLPGRHGVKPLERGPQQHRKRQHHDQEE